MKKPKIEFAEGCFDHLLDDGMTQEEIDELVEHITELANAGKLFEDAQELSPEELEQVTYIMERQVRNTRQ